MKVIVLIIVIYSGPGLWTPIPKQHQTLGWTDCEDRARVINEAVAPTLLVWCDEIVK